MSVHRHALAGCRPTPLAHYLKALGVLRLVAQQADPSARGAWQDEHFVLVSQLDQEALREFFLERYAPTPLVTPWNGGSGFYPKDNKQGIDPLVSSTAPRFSVYRDAIEQCRRLIGARQERPSGVEKEAMLREARRRWRGPLADWLDAAVTLASEGSPAYPAMLGTGGNDGRLDFTNNFMQRLSELFDVEAVEGGPRAGVAELLDAALFGSPQLDLGSTAVGQFFPGAAGGANGSTGFSSPTLVNPWDFVLMLEGTLLFASSVTRRAVVGGLPQAAAPFAMRSAAVGYGSAAEENSRGEQWMPIWSGLARFTELQKLLAEARCQSKRTIAQRPLETARAIARLGVARGISGFERYGYIERNGLSNLAVPLGRWQVAPQPHQQLLDEIGPWYERLERAAADKNAPAGMPRAARRCQEAMLHCCRDGAAPARWLELLIRLGEAETQLLHSPQFTAAKRLQPLGNPRPLSAGWLLAAQALGDRPEFRLALAIASQHGSRTAERRGRDAGEAASILLDRGDPIRRHWLPLAEREGGGVARPVRFALAGERLASKPDVVCHGLDLPQDLLALFERRLLLARRDAGLPWLGLHPAFGAEATLADVQAWLEGDVDQRLVQSLLRPLLALDWQDVSDQLAKADAPVRRWLRRVDDRNEQYRAEQLALYGLFKLGYHYEPLTVRKGELQKGELPTGEPQTGEADMSAGGLVQVAVKLEAQPFQRLRAGDLAGAVAAACRRLRISGLQPHVDRGVGDARLARRIAASLAIPLRRSSMQRLAAALTHPTLDPASEPEDEHERSRREAAI